MLSRARSISIAGSLAISLWLTPSIAARQDEIPPQPSKGKRVCVAIVANSTTKPMFVERLTDRLVKSLRESRIDAVGLHSRTTTNPRLDPTQDNRKEFRDQDCDYLLLTQVAQPIDHPFEPAITIGGRTPSVDASDSRPVLRDQLLVEFALYRQGRWKPVLNENLGAEESSSVTETAYPAMDRVASRVSRGVNKK